MRSIPERSGADRAYGETRYTWGTTPTDYRFTGQRLTESLGLIHMGARWYDPYLGRWLSPDSIVPEPGNPQSLNRYSFVLGNPLKYIDPSGHNEEDTCGPNEVCPDQPPDWWIQLMSDPEFLAWLATQVDSWLWDNVPSALGYYGSINGSLGCIFEGELSAQVSLLFNWRSGELSLLYGPGAGAFLGTPRGGSVTLGGGTILTYGAHRNELLKGINAYGGGTLGVDAFVEASLEAQGSVGLTYQDINNSGTYDAGDKAALVVDPVSGQHIVSLQAGVSAGANATPNGVEAGGRGGLSSTSGFNIISGWSWKGWPWNWGRYGR